MYDYDLIQKCALYVGSRYVHLPTWDGIKGWALVEHLNTFVINRLTWGDNIPHYSENQDGSYPINLSTDQMENYLKVFYVTFNEPEGEQKVYRVERRNVY